MVKVTSRDMSMQAQRRGGDILQLICNLARDEMGSEHHAADALPPRKYLVHIH